MEGPETPSTIFVRVPKPPLHPDSNRGVEANSEAPRAAAQAVVVVTPLS